jgi:hypothetical protein
LRYFCDVLLRLIHYSRKQASNLEQTPGTFKLSTQVVLSIIKHELKRRRENTKLKSDRLYGNFDFI